MGYFEDTLAGLREEDNYRSLRTVRQEGNYIVYDGKRYLNMSSNDYLGLAADAVLQKKFLNDMADSKRFLMSNSASRLMTGNSADYDELEEAIAALYPGRECLVLGSGYAVNSGILPAVTFKGDLVLADKLVHASLIDGLRLCECEWRRYRHNDMEHLENIVRKVREEDAGRRILIVTESVFSMDGDQAPLKCLVNLKRRYGLLLMVDEAHAFGVFGPRGEGLAAELGVAGEIDILIGTFGKALASAGGFSIVEPVLKQLLVNRMRTLIFSTAMPPINLQWTKLMVENLPSFAGRRAHLKKLTGMTAGFTGKGDATHIIPIMAYDNAAAQQLAYRLREAGYWVTPIRYPTVPKDEARIRVSLTASMNTDDVENFLEECRRIG